MPLASTLVPKHPEIARRLRYDVMRGQFRKADRLPSNRDLATLFEATPITVRKALQTLTDQGFLEVRPHHGTFIPDDLRSLHALAGIEVLVKDLMTSGHPYVAGILAGLESELSLAKRFSLHLTPMPAEGHDLRLRQLQAMDRGGMIDGVVVTDMQAPAVVSALWDLGLPLVVVGDDHGPGYPTVLQDLAQGAGLLAERLNTLGCKRVHIVMRHLENPAKEASGGFHDTLNKAAAASGIELIWRLIPLTDQTAFNRQGCDIVHDLLENDNLDCLVCSGTPLCEAIRPLIQPHETLPFVAISDDPLAGYAHNLVLPVSRMGALAGRLLQRQLVKGRQECVGINWIPFFWSESSR